MQHSCIYTSYFMYNKGLRRRRDEGQEAAGVRRRRSDSKGPGVCRNGVLEENSRCPFGDTAGAQSLSLRPPCPPVQVCAADWLHLRQSQSCPRTSLSPAGFPWLLSRVKNGASSSAAPRSQPGPPAASYRRHRSQACPLLWAVRQPWRRWTLGCGSTEEACGEVVASPFGARGPRGGAFRHWLKMGSRAALSRSGPRRPWQLPGRSPIVGKRKKKS